MNNFLLLGGTRSGKSQFGEELAIKIGKRKAYIATAQNLSSDKEMAKRILTHKKRRDDIFTNIEEPIELAKAINKAAKNHDVILVDCLSIWVSNLMEHGHDIKKAEKTLINSLKKNAATNVIFISSEVGLGIVPNNKLAREFRDHVGLLHQSLAKICANCYFIVAGLPMVLKGELVK